MGCMPKMSCGGGRWPVSTTQWLPNPDAKKFVLDYALEIDDYLIVQVRYPDCVNFEGNKIMVYRGLSIEQFKKRTEVDPHFKDYDKTSPIARFIPTKEGWNMAVRFVNSQVSSNLEKL